MKKFFIVILLMAFVLACAEEMPAQNPADYTISVHVQSSQVVDRFQSSEQYLNVTIDGKKYQLASGPSLKVLPVGDYKAKISKDKIAKTHEYSRVYELLFADGTTRKYTVVGESE
jgi:hypothetical protein